MPFNQRINDAITPNDPAWQNATGADRLAFFQEAGKVARAIKIAELKRAIGADGRRMKARKRPREDGANGPVLTPHDEASRTIRLMASHADVNGMTLFWRSGHSNVQRLPWGTILGFHAGGTVRGAPSRDVRLSPLGIRQVKKQMQAWWVAYVARENARQAAQDRQRRIAAAEAAEIARKADKPAVRAARAVQAELIKRNKKMKEYFQPRGRGF